MINFEVGKVYNFVHLGKRYEHIEITKITYKPEGKWIRFKDGNTYYGILNNRITNIEEVKNDTNSI